MAAPTDHVPPPSGPAVESVAQVLSTLQGVLSIDATTRSGCEALLRAWEADAVPGFLVSLLQIVEQAQAVEEPIRVMAAVVAKNAVGSSWRKTLGSREWSRVPPQEQAAVRHATLQLLLNDVSNRVATQLGLLLANIARFDFPARAPDLLDQLMAAAVWPQQAGLPRTQHLRALKTLRAVLAALGTKRFVVETPRSSGAGSQAFMDLRAAAGAIAHERAVFASKLQQAAAPLTQLFLNHTEAFLSVAPEWAQHALMAKAAATCLAERLPLTPAVDKLPERAEELLNACRMTLAVVMGSPPAGLDAQSAALWYELGGKVSERVCRVIIGHLDTHAIAFAGYVPAFLELFVGGALLAADAAAVRHMRPKRRVLLVRFIAKALLSPFYRPEWTEAPMPPILKPEQREQLQENRARAGLAQAALEHLLGSAQGGGDGHGHGSLLIEAVVSKYIALTPEELLEWQDDPESYARSMEVESSPDAETPRPIGVGLLLCMLERGGEPVAQALLQLAGRAQATPGPEAVLLREATYRCIGEGFSHVSQHVAFSAWYANELEPMLSTRLPQLLAGNAPEGVIASVLQARALWLVGVCAAELQPSEWGGAFRLAAAHMAAVDVVVALSAVGSCLALCGPLLDDQSTVESHEKEERKRDAGGATGLVAAMALNDRGGAMQQLDSQELDEEKILVQQAKERIAMRIAAAVEAAGPALQAAFGLLSRLTEVESMVRVLQLVSVLVEALDVHIQPHLPIIAAALPRIWEAAAQHSAAAEASSQAARSLAASAAGSASKRPGEPGDIGAVVRLHSALLAVLTHLVGKLKSVALADSQVADVVYPLLRFATSLGSQESECLVDEAFRLWGCTLSALPEVPPQLADLLPNLAALLRRGRDAPQTFPLVEAYLLLGAAPHVIPMLDLIQSAMLACIHGVEQAALSSLAPVDSAGGAGGQAPMGGPAPGGGGAPTTRSFAGESAAEALATSALTDVMLQLSPSEVPSLLAPTFAAMVHFVTHPGIPALDCDARLVNCMEGFLEVLGRVFLVQPSSFESVMAASAPAGPPGTQPPPGTPTDVDAITSSFLDKWLTIASHTYIEETLGVKVMAMLGRYRRRIATAALVALAASGKLPRALWDAPPQITRVAALACRAVLDDSEFHSDQAELDNLDFKGDLFQDRVLARRLVVTRADPVRALKVGDAVRGLLGALASGLGGAENFLTLLSAHGSPRLAMHASTVLSGNLAPLAEGSEEEDGRGLSGPEDDDGPAGTRGGPNTALLADLSD